MDPVRIPRSTLFANRVLWLFIASHVEEDGLPKPVVAGPLGELDRATRTGSTQVQRFITPPIYEFELTIWL